VKSIGVSSLEEMATGIRDQALTLALAKVAPGRRSAQLVELLERPRFRNAFIQALAMGVAQALAANDQRVLAVYAYPAAPPPGATVARQETSLAHLMVLVTSSSAALEVFVAALNRALRVSLSGITGKRFGQGHPLLDINILTEQQRQQGLGLTRLLSADQPRPIMLWQRQAKPGEAGSAP
jgi:hypothetical protein